MHTVCSSVTSAILGEKGIGMLRGLVYLQHGNTGGAHRLFRDSQAEGLCVRAAHTKQAWHTGSFGEGRRRLRDCVCVQHTHKTGMAHRLVWGRQA